MIRLLHAIFFLSGAAGLVFETLWFRQAGLAFGNSVWASSLVLSSFMLGLGLGNGLAARFAERLRRPVRFYAFLEVLIACTGVVLVWTLPSLGPALAPLLGGLVDAPWLLNPLRLVLSFGLLLIPATAMGATLPILMRAVVARRPNFGAVLGRLYGWNTLGAVTGVVVTEMWLLEWVGIRTTGLVAGGLDIAAAAGAWAVSRGLPAAKAAAVSSRPDSRTRIPGRAWVLVAAALFSGAALLALEVIWFRFLQLFVAGTALAFSLMLASVLLGIALGGLAAGAWLQRRPRDHSLAGAVALAAGFCAAVAYPAFVFAVGPFEEVLAHRAQDILALTLALSLPTSLLSGMLFTFLGASLNQTITSAARAAGVLTLANTLGAGIGSAAAGFWLLPQLGMERSLWLLSGSYALVAALALVGSPHSVRRKPLVLAGATAAAFAGAILLFPSGLMRDHFIAKAVQRVAREGSWQIDAIREGLTETVVYLRKRIGRETHYQKLMTNGFSMSGTAWGSRRYMKLYTWWPVALAPQSRRALLISYGVGTTAKSLTDTASLKEIDVVDLSREILELSRVVYPQPEDNPLRDPRVRVHVEDGRYFLQTTDQRWDLITGEPPPPKYAGVVNLYTREYFQLIRDRLSPGGVSTYWLPVHSLRESDTKAVIRAYCDVFPDCSLWTGWQWNWMLVGSRGADWSRARAPFEQQWEDPKVGGEMRQLGLETPEQLGALFMADADQLADLVGPVEPLVDDYPKRLSDRLPSTAETRATYSPWLEIATLRQRFASSAFIRRAWPPALRERGFDSFWVQRIINDRGVRPGLQRGAGERIAELDRLLRETELRVPVLWNLGTTPDRLRMFERSRTGPATASSLESSFRSARAVADRNLGEAARQLEHAQAGNPRNASLFYTRLYILCRLGRIAEAQGLARKAADWLPHDRGDHAYWRWMRDEFDIESVLNGSGS